MFPEIKVIYKCKTVISNYEICNTGGGVRDESIWHIDTWLHLPSPHLHYYIYTFWTSGNWVEVVFLELQFLCGMLKS